MNELEEVRQKRIKSKASAAKAKAKSEAEIGLKDTKIEIAGEITFFNSLSIKVYIQEIFFSF